MRPVCSVLLMVAFFAAAATALPAAKGADKSAVTPARIAPEAQAQQAKGKIEAKPQEAITISIAPLQKSAEPLPGLLIPQRSPGKHKVNARRALRGDTKKGVR